jgi:hypothetical protein
MQETVDGCECDAAMVSRWARKEPFFLVCLACDIILVLIAACEMESPIGDGLRWRADRS